MKRLFLLLAMMPLVFISCSKDDSGDGNSEKIVGIWALLDYDEYEKTHTVHKMYEFETDGTFTCMSDPRYLEFKDGCVYNYDPYMFRIKSTGKYSVKDNMIVITTKDEYLEADYVFYDDDQIKIHQTYGWEIEDGEKVEMESSDEYIIIHRVKKLM